MQAQPPPMPPSRPRPRPLMATKADACVDFPAGRRPRVLSEDNRATMGNDTVDQPTPLRTRSRTGGDLGRVISFCSNTDLQDTGPQLNLKTEAWFESTGTPFEKTKRCQDRKWIEAITKGRERQLQGTYVAGLIPEEHPALSSQKLGISDRHPDDALLATVAMKDLIRVARQEARNDGDNGPTSADDDDVRIALVRDRRLARSVRDAETVLWHARHPPAASITGARRRGPCRGLDAGHQRVAPQAPGGFSLVAAAEAVAIACAEDVTAAAASGIATDGDAEITMSAPRPRAHPEQIENIREASLQVPLCMSQGPWDTRVGGSKRFGLAGFREVGCDGCNNHACNGQADKGLVGPEAGSISRKQAVQVSPAPGGVGRRRTSTEGDDDFSTNGTGAKAMELWIGMCHDDGISSSVRSSCLPCDSRPSSSTGARSTPSRQNRPGTARAHRLLGLACSGRLASARTRSCR
eukprot:TRINITY_DN21831_c0_g1_i1.p1 TRINITY_DN21831_c0_g1~~TRINITY_DN21831_c0_g1_i1.p1  ORF type:complete len:495 (-),score=52.35 TRINITY_DN21831_c0_g1_i1:32-1429(-)